MLANYSATELGDVGAIVLGPVGTLEDAMVTIQAEQELDGAVIDMNLRGKMFFLPQTCYSMAVRRSRSPPATMHRQSRLDKRRS